MIAGPAMMTRKPTQTIQRTLLERLRTRWERACTAAQIRLDEAREALEAETAWREAALKPASPEAPSHSVPVGGLLVCVRTGSVQKLGMGVQMLGDRSVHVENGRLFWLTAGNEMQVRYSNDQMEIGEAVYLIKLFPSDRVVEEA